jgi:hypothetical protein
MRRSRNPQQRAYRGKVMALDEGSAREPPEEEESLREPLRKPP